MARCAMLGYILALLITALVRGGHVVTAEPKGSVALPVDLRWRQLRVDSLHRGLALLTVFSGIVGPVNTRSAQTWLSFCINLRPEFGLLLLTFVISSFFWHLATPHSSRQSDMRQFSRRLGLNVYLLLYVVIFIRAIIELVRASWDHGLFKVELMQNYLHMSSEQVTDEFRWDFGGYIAGGVLAIIMIRVFTVAYSRSAKNAVAPP